MEAHLSSFRSKRSHMRRFMFAAACVVVSSASIGLTSGTAHALSLAVPATQVHEPIANPVLAASAQPEDYSLTSITRKAASFITSGSNPTYYPNTPFQILYSTNASAQPSGTGIVVTGTNSFSVARETPFYVPLTNVTDSPPVLGVYPTTPAAAKPYFFSQSQLGGRDFEVSVDGRSTPLGPEYLVGPLTTPPLLDGGGTHIVNLGAFVRPLRPGTHTVSFSGTFSGDVFAAANGVSFVHLSFTYTVTVLPDEND